MDIRGEVGYMLMLMGLTVGCSSIIVCSSRWVDGNAVKCTVILFNPAT